MTPESFADRLNRLFEEKRKPDGSQYTQAEVAEATQGHLTRVYLWKLRTGRATNPGLHIIQALAGVFGVDPGYFIDGDDQAASPAGLALENDLVNKIALRSSRLDEEGKKTVLEMIDYILKAKESKKKE